MNNEKIPLLQPQVNYNSVLSDEVKRKIMNELIETNYYLDVKDTISARRKWRKSGHIFETTSKICLAMSSIFSFSSGFFQNPYYSFLAGSMSTISLASLQFSSYCFRQSKKNTDELNIVLKSIGIHSFPSPVTNEIENDTTNKNDTNKEET